MRSALHLAEDREKDFKTEPLKRRTNRRVKAVAVAAFSLGIWAGRMIGGLAPEYPKIVFGIAMAGLIVVMMAGDTVVVAAT